MSKKTIPQATFIDNTIRLLPDQVKDQASQLKADFDYTAIQQKIYNNTVLLVALANEDLNNSGSNTVGHNSTGITANNVGDALEENRQLSEDNEDNIITNANNIAQNVLDITDLQTDKADKSDTYTKSEIDTLDDENVKKTGDQSISGVKTYAQSPIIPETPVSDTEAASKGYVDTEIAGVVLGQIPDNSLDLIKNTPKARALITNKSYDNTGTADDLVATTDGQVDYTIDNWITTVVPTSNNTGAMTANIDGQGVKDIKKVVDGLYVAMEIDDAKALEDLAIRWSVGNDFFVHAPSGSGGNVAWLQLYDVGDLWDETLASPSGNNQYMVSIGTDVYVKSAAAPYRLWKYDTLTNTWDETLTPPSANSAYMVAVGTDIYVQQSASPYAIWKYDTLLNSWDETLANPSANWNHSVAVGTDIYARASNGTDIWKYDTLLDTWDETLTPPSGGWVYSSAVGTDIYVRQDASPYKVWKYDTLLDAWDETLSSPSNFWTYPTASGTDLYIRASNELIFGSMTHF